MVSIFKNISDTSQPYYIKVDDALDRVKNGKSKEAVERVRATSDKELRGIAKQSLPCITFSGKFTKRTDKNLIEHSGFVILDFDHVPDVEKYKTDIFKEDFVYAVWVSPSGDGVKALVKINALWIALMLVLHPMQISSSQLQQGEGVVQ